MRFNLSLVRAYPCSNDYMFLGTATVCCCLGCRGAWGACVCAGVRFAGGLNRESCYESAQIRECPFSAIMDRTARLGTSILLGNVMLVIGEVSLVRSHSSMAFLS